MTISASFSLSRVAERRPEADLVVCPASEDGVPAWASALGAAVTGELVRAYERREFRGKPGELYFTTLEDGARTRLALVGVGRPTAEESAPWRDAASAAVLAGRARGCRRFALLAGRGEGAVLQALVEGAVLGGFDVGSLRSEHDSASLDEVAILVDEVADEAWAAVERGRILGEATNLARDLANQPGNLLAPRDLAERAARAGASAGLDVEILDEQALAALGMNLLLAVGQGSAQPPRLVVLRHEPALGTAGPTLALIGKGITFDTGGISIKPADKMEQMKFDMAGAAAVIGAMQVIGRLRPAVRVVGIVPAAENMPGGRALRPGDVIRSASGLTVEVNNTDAEGRLILADALWFAREKAGATHLVDVATLTVACVIALGHAASGLFGTPTSWTDLLREVATRAGERVWPLPLFEDYRDQLKSEIADLVNTGGRPAGACTAAKFLEAFTGGRPWAHLDIAGTAWLEEARPHMPKGPTGVMTRTLATLALEHARLP